MRRMDSLRLLVLSLALLGVACDRGWRRSRKRPTRATF